MSKKEIMKGFNFAIGYTLGMSVLKVACERILKKAGYEKTRGEYVKYHPYSDNKEED